MEYIGGLDIESLDPVGYKVSFNFDRSEMPLVIIADLPDEEFLPFIKTKLDVVLFNALPFNILKGLVIGAITMMIYKKLTPILKGETWK